MNFVSPGVYFREVDLSLYLPNLSSTILGMVGTATRGPVNTPTYISNVAAFTNVFGNPHPNHLATYSALEYLRYGRQLWFVRVNSSSSAKAQCQTLKGTATQAKIVASQTGPFTFFPSYGAGFLGTNDDATVDVTSGDNKLYLSINGAAPVTITLTPGVGVAKAAIIGEIDAALSGLGASAIAGNTFRDGTGLATQVAIQVDGVGSSTRLDLVAGANSAYALLGFTAGTYYGANGISTMEVTSYRKSTATTATATVDFSWDAAQSLDNVVTTIEAALNAVPVPITASVVGGRLQLTHDSYGEDYEIMVSLPSAALPTDVGAFTLLGITPDVWVSGRGALPNVETMKLFAHNEGTWGNNLAVVVGPGSATDTFKITVQFSGAVVEVWDNLVSSPELEDAEVGSRFFVDAITDVSSYLLAEDVGGDMGFPVYGTYTFSGGLDGLDAVSDDDFIGAVSGSTRTGLQCFGNPEEIDVNLIAIPGIHSPNVINEMLSLCITRGDCMAIIDPPLGLSVQQVTDWHNGANAYADHQAFNSSYGALYWPWCKVYDAVNDTHVWTPPSGHLAAIYAYTDNNTELWYAPAGYTRGRIIVAKELEHSPDLGERDLLYGNMNAINPIVKFQKDGIVVWGQRTLQRKPTALDRVNVRRLILYLRKVLASSIRYFVFEPNDPITWLQFTGVVEPYLQTIKDRRGLYDFRVVCDETTNTPELIDRGVMAARVYLKPTKAAEVIQVDLVLTPTGASFDEAVY